MTNPAPRKARVTLPLPAGCTARRVAGGRKGATRWEIWLGPAPPVPVLEYDGWLGELVRWQPEGTWSWQPAGLFDGAPETEGTLPECAAALAAAALAAALAAAGIDPGDLVPDYAPCPLCGLPVTAGACTAGHGPDAVAAWLRTDN